MLVKSSFEHFIYVTLNKISNYCFHLNAIIFLLLLVSKNKSEIRFQYLVYYIISKCNTYDNKYTAIYLIFIYLFQCERNMISFGDN